MVTCPNTAMGQRSPYGKRPRWLSAARARFADERPARPSSNESQAFASVFRLRVARPCNNIS